MKKLNKEIEKVTKGFPSCALDTVEDNLLCLLRFYMNTKEGRRLDIISKDKSIKYGDLTGNKSMLKIIQELQKKAGL